MISQRVTRHTLRFGALLLAALLLLAATLSLDQLREYLGALGAQLADLFHFLIVFSLFMFLLERLSARTVANVAVATLAAVLAWWWSNADAGLASGNAGELSSISTIFSLPFLLDVVEQDTLTLRILNFMQVYLTFAVMAICTLLVVALVHVIYLLHENRWIKVVHGASLVFFSLPFLVWAMATVNPDVPLAGRDPLGAPVRRDRLVRQLRVCWLPFRPGRSSDSSASQVRRRLACSPGSTRSRSISSASDCS